LACLLGQFEICRQIPNLLKFQICRRHIDYKEFLQPIFHQKDWFFPFKSGTLLIIIWAFTGFLVYVGIRRLGKIIVCLKGFFVVAMLVNMFTSIFSINYKIIVY
jgi:hypothetical protein